MEIIRRYRNGKKQSFPVYTQAEADAEGLTYVRWQDAKAGEWALTDDGYVGECWKVNGPYLDKWGRPRSEHVFTYARKWSSPKARILYKERKIHRSWSRACTGSWAATEMKNKRAKRFLMAYVMMFMSGKGIDWERLGLIYRPNDEPWRQIAQVKHLFKQEECQRMVEEKVAEVLIGKGMTPGKVVEMFEETYKMAKADRDIKEMRRITENFRDLLDMLPRPETGALPPWMGTGEPAEFEDIAGQIEAAKTQIPAQTGQAPVPPVAAVIPDAPAELDPPPAKDGRLISGV